MTAFILDGKKVRAVIQETLTHTISLCEVKPKLVIIHVGDNSESQTYIRQKINFGKTIGAHVELIQISHEKAQQEALIDIIKTCNQDDSIHGIIVQLPLPVSIEKEVILNTISSLKDVDGLTQDNQELLERGSPRFVPATARGIFVLLDAYEISVYKKKVVVIGRSLLVGRPVADLARMRGGEVTVIHSKTENPIPIIHDSDIVIVAAGVRHLVGIESVRSGQVIVDVGIHVEEKDGSRIISGDVDFESVKHAVMAISPVPGGVGVMTVSALFLNLIDAWNIQTQSCNK